MYLTAYFNLPIMTTLGGVAYTPNGLKEGTCAVKNEETFQYSACTLMCLYWDMPIWCDLMDFLKLASLNKNYEYIS